MHAFDAAKRGLRIVTTLAAALLGTSCAPDGADSESGDARLGSVIAEKAANGFAGAVYVSRRGEVLIDAAYGEAGGAPLTASSQFWIASAGKQFVSAAIMKLVDRGAIELDRSIADYLPAVPEDKRAITMRQLLAHASGLPQSYVAEGADGLADALQKLLAIPVEAAPGERFIYSNANYQLAAALIETVTGQSYDDFLKSALLDPLGLDNTGRAGWPGAQKIAAIDGPLPERLTKKEWGEQGVYSSTHDLAKWYEALAGGEVLSAASLEEMFEPVTAISVGHSALGWFLSETESGHPFRFVRGNEDFGANALLYAYPEDDVVIVVLTHAGDKDEDSSWSRAILADIEDHLF